MITKVYKTGNVIEVYRYEKYFSGSGGAVKHDEDFVSDLKDTNYKNHCIRRLNTIRRIACSNFNNTSVFLTLTFNDKLVNHDIKNVKECNKVFKKFIKRLRYRISYDFKYLAVIEFQDTNNRGAVHYHVLLDIPYIDSDLLSEIWGLGFIKVNKIDNVDNVGAYIVKYINKDNGDRRLQGLPSFLHSKNCVLPVSTIYITDSDYNPCSNLKAVYETDYTTELFGSVNYKQYNLSRQQPPC